VERPLSRVSLPLCPLHLFCLRLARGSVPYSTSCPHSHFPSRCHRCSRTR
jgi:hypothetical protein